MPASRRPRRGEGLDSEGCPLGSHPAQLSDNRNCVLCMTCVQACPNRSVQLRLRPPAADLQRRMDTPDGERGLILVLAGGICLHHWQRLLGWLPLAPMSLHEGPLLPRLSFAALALAIPAAAGIWLSDVGCLLTPALGPAAGDIYPGDVGSRRATGRLAPMAGRPPRLLSDIPGGNRMDRSGVLLRRLVDLNRWVG